MAKWLGLGKDADDDTDGAETSTKKLQYKTDRQILEAIWKKLLSMDERLSELEEVFCDENGNGKELNELKKETGEQSQFLRTMVMTLIENKKVTDAKPTAAQQYLIDKKEREEKEAAAAEAKRKGNGGKHLPG